MPIQLPRFRGQYPNFSFSLRGLCELVVREVNKGFRYTHRRDAENAEEAQRISNQDAASLEYWLQPAVDPEDSG